MTQEEKAKAYDKALNIAREILDHTSENYLCTHLTKEDIKDMYIRFFPELKESEDEKIKKAIHIYLDWLDGHKDYQPKGDYTIKDMLAWLEKQGEQKASYTTLAETGNGGINALVTRELSNSCDYEEKPVGKVEPKFKVGDWVVNKGHSYLIADIDFLDNRYLFEIGGYTHEQLNWEYIENVDNKYHLWTIADAKDGDILMSRAPFIYGKQCPYGGINWYNGKFIKASNYVFKDSPVHPATKEQRDLLFTKMREAGYEWSDKNRKLSHSKVTKISDQVQKSAWSEEDEKIFGRICALIHSAAYMNYDVDEDGNECGEYANIKEWFKKLKDRVQLQNITITDEELVQAKKDAYNDALDKIEYHSGEPTFDDGWSAAIWYLKKRNAQPQNRWKPSDEQMADLWNMLCECRPADHQLLQNIYYGLKKLREDKVWGK